MTPANPKPVLLPLTMADTNGAERASPACFASERDLDGSASRPSDVKELRIAIIGAGTLVRERGTFFELPKR